MLMKINDLNDFNNFGFVLFLFFFGGKNDKKKLNCWKTLSQDLLSVEQSTFNARVAFKLKIFTASLLNGLQRFTQPPSNCNLFLSVFKLILFYFFSSEN